MPLTRPSLPVRSLSALGGALALGLLLSGTVAPAEGQNRPARAFRGSGCLPLSGDLSAAGDAFRRGFLAGLSENPDSLFGWDWQWTDNGSAPDLTQAWMDSSGNTSRPDLRLTGLGPTMDGLRTRPDSIPCLYLGDGPIGPSNLWHIWPTAERMRHQVLAWLQDAPKPIAVVVVASGPWAEIILGGLKDSLPDLLILPHDLDNTRWDEEIKRLLETQPGTILFWNRPHEASSLLSRRLGWKVFRKARLLIPEGTVLPDSVNASIVFPVWQPSSPPDSLQNLGYLSWGREVGRALAKASQIVVSDSSMSLFKAFPKVKLDSLAGETMTNGWIPILSPSLAHPPQIPGPH